MDIFMIVYHLKLTMVLKNSWLKTQQMMTSTCLHTILSNAVMFWLQRRNWFTCHAEGSYAKLEHIETLELSILRDDESLVKSITCMLV